VSATLNEPQTPDEERSRPVAIVTAASRGIGAACARELSARGYRLSLLARSEEIEALAAELRAVAVRGSVTETADLQRLVAVTSEAYGRIDAVVDNTGHAAKGELLALTDEEWHEGLDLLLLGAVRLARIVTPTMLKQRAGAFVNISTFAAAEPGLQFPVSAVLRSGLGNFAKLYSRQFAGSGLRMNNVLPGWVETYPVAAEIVATIPARRVARVEEIATVVAFLASADAGYVTGESLLVDGGFVRSA
jgi:NAD(P)-dependent dehydrogenase (short-subunit alcohol dehydrogenase family)